MNVMNSKILLIFLSILSGQAHAALECDGDINDGNSSISSSPVIAVFKAACETLGGNPEGYIDSRGRHFVHCANFSGWVSYYYLYDSKMFSSFSGTRPPLATIQEIYAKNIESGLIKVFGFDSLISDPDGRVARSACQDLRDQTVSPKQPITPCAQNSMDSFVGNPIDVVSGNKFQMEIDYESQKSLGLKYIRYYNSVDRFSIYGGVAPKWSYNYRNRIYSAGFYTTVARFNGQGFGFTFDGNNWIGDADVPDTLIELTDTAGIRTGWEYRDSEDNVEVYNATGQLLSITNRAGLTQTLEYDLTLAEGGDDDGATLDKVTGPYGEVMGFSYDSSHRITTMTDPEGQTYHYDYDTSGNLVSVTYPDNTPNDMTDNPTRLYHYEDSRFPHHLTGITDENGIRYATWRYDEQGRAISSEHAGMEKETLDYSIGHQVTVTNALGKHTTYHFTTLHGVKKVTQVEGHASANCLAANKSYSYDANGYLQSKTDWQGHTTTYIHNERGLEESRTEADGTSEARTITTEWETNFRLPKIITAPGKITEFSYDNQGRLLSTVVSD